MCVYRGSIRIIGRIEKRPVFPKYFFFTCNLRGIAFYYFSFFLLFFLYMALWLFLFFSFILEASLISTLLCWLLTIDWAKEKKRKETAKQEKNKRREWWENESWCKWPVGVKRVRLSRQVARDSNRLDQSSGVQEMLRSKTQRVN